MKCYNQKLEINEMKKTKMSLLEVIFRSNAALG